MYPLLCSGLKGFVIKDHGSLTEEYILKETALVHVLDANKECQ